MFKKSSLFFILILLFNKTQALFWPESKKLTSEKPFIHTSVPKRYRHFRTHLSKRADKETREKSVGGRKTLNLAKFMIERPLIMEDLNRKTAIKKRDASKNLNGNQSKDSTIIDIPEFIRRWQASVLRDQYYEYAIFNVGRDDWLNL